ncbi:SPOR domain-containing protein [Persephonella atlantica]|uniref:SPOR domain-containing protein n=1 Tax=Persephonella atlantica TaxID=2699429 RepID=A0ABS1GII5_9AQUI|nr:SPOR domain-containing protein [Persephonella atlantica]MBK3332724.1 SPOR domain-containing protein [Persephonella atlantica]
MEPDLKDTIKKLEEAKSRQEKIERIIILLSGLLIVIIFSIIGINIYTDREETVSEPEITIISQEVKKTEVTPKETKSVMLPQTPPPQVQKETAVQAKKQTELEKKEEVKEKKKTVKIDKPSSIHGFYIQVGAFSSKKKAERLVKNLRMKNVFIRKEGELYKVMIGSFKNKKEAYNFMKAKNIKGFIRKI